MIHSLLSAELGIDLIEPPRHVVELAHEHHRDRRQEIGKVVMREGSQFLDSYQSAYSRGWELLHEIDSELTEKLLSPLAATVVVDVGCGRGTAFRDTTLARAVIRGYIGVDHLADLDPLETIVTDAGPLQDTTTVTPEGITVPSLHIKGDVLDLVARLPDGSVSFALNGIDWTQVEPESPYGIELAQQIIRATKPGGGVVARVGEISIVNTIAKDPNFVDIASNGQELYRSYLKTK